MGNAIGGGGGFLSAIGGIVGTIFGGPIGSMIGQMIGGMLDQALSGAMQNNGVGQEQQGQAQEAYRDAYRQASGGLEPNSPAGGGSLSDQVDSFADAAGATEAERGDLQRQVADLQDMVNKLVTQANEADANSAQEGKPGKSDSWLVAIAKAMGGVAGKFAAEVVKLSQDMGNVKTGGSSSQQQEAAKQMQQLNAEFQAQTQMLNLVSNSISTGLKSIGEAMTTIARKQ